MSEPKFIKAEAIVNFPEVEEKIPNIWRKSQTFQKSLKLREVYPDFVWHDGPPTANGIPYNSHELTRVSKDLFLPSDIYLSGLCRLRGAK